ncbi:hypothetical protein C0Q70_20921 [Pomacea canaliculata]|uniref:TIR domain-containing protein n=1 Tax=Pomacea canaliculata TaxID=400727 RepID=A0A2T7NB51_POMCA|nr:hypothetical protein C0Q70_20921 [Pomacea canaliculata]
MSTSPTRWKASLSRWKVAVIQCIVQDRDFPLGAAIQDNIVRAADSCSRAVFVLSDDIGASEWFLFTFHVVFDRCQQHRDRRVLLVLRAALNADRLTSDVQQAVRTSAVLREQDPWFEARCRSLQRINWFSVLHPPDFVSDSLCMDNYRRKLCSITNRCLPGDRR